jgi:Flavodoxin domain
MNALVVYESMYGNTKAVASAIAEGLGGATSCPVHEAPLSLDGVDLLVVGGPTHVHGLASNMSRRSARDEARKAGHDVIEEAKAGPGLRRWLHELADVDELRAAAFDTRMARARWVTGTAARSIGRRLRAHGCNVIAAESFLVGDMEGPLEPGELKRARAWGVELRARTEATVNA